MNEDPRARLGTVAAALIHAYRQLCTHAAESAPLSECPGCELIGEVIDMIRCSADSEFEASALCSHFVRELHAVQASSRTAPSGAPWAGLHG